MAKVKAGILKTAREKQGISIRLSAGFSTETLQARREWQDTFKVLKGKYLQPRILHPGRVSFTIEGVLSCTPQAYKPCTCPSLRPKKDPGVSDRDLSGLMGGESFMSEARSWNDTPPCVADSG